MCHASTYPSGVSAVQCVESLLDDVLQWESLLLSWLVMLQLDTPLSSENEDDDPVPVSNYFAVVEKLTELAATRFALEQPAPVCSNTRRKCGSSPMALVSNGKHCQYLSPPAVSHFECPPPSLQLLTHLLQRSTRHCCGDVSPPSYPGGTLSINSIVPDAANDNQSIMVAVGTGNLKSLLLTLSFVLT
eukprot:superscaffoldBa00007611_g22689